MLPNCFSRASLRRSWNVLLKVGLVLLLVGGMVEMVRAQKMKQIGEPIPYNQIDPNWQDCGLRKIDVNTFTSVRSSRRKQARKAATIDVTYNDFSNQAREAFQRAVDIWERHIDSDITIRIDAAFANLAPNTLGGTRPSFVYAVDTEGDGDEDTVFGDALFDALDEEDQQPGEADIIIEFNRNRDDWHFGEADAPSGRIDFTSVALHEITHGLDYFSITSVDNPNSADPGQGSYGGIDFNEDGSPDGIPYSFVRFLARNEPNNSLTPLTEETVFPNPSQELGDALTSDRLVFDGSRSRAAAKTSTGPVPAKVYTPTQYNPGSSISHLNEATYPAGDVNALMTPRVNTSETNRKPGPIVCGQLGDMGWTLGDQCNQYFQNFVDLSFDQVSNGTQSDVTLNWEEPSNTTVQEYQVEVKKFDGTFEAKETGISSPPVTIENLGLGQFGFRVRWIDSNGNENVSLTTLTKTVNIEQDDLTANVASRDEQGRGTVELDWAVPPGTPERFSYRVERAPESSENFREIGSNAQEQFVAEGQTPGRYRYRIVSMDGQGNSLISEPKPVEITFDGSVFITGPYPNPVQDRATVELTAKRSQDVSIEVFNTLGERVFVQEERVFEKRPVQLNFSPTDRQWASGVYILRVSGSEFTETRQMVVVR